MKKLILTLSLIAGIAMSSVGQEYLAGAFYSDKDVEAHLITMTGTVSTNQLLSGKTYKVSDDAMIEITSTETTTLYFAGGPMVELGTNSVITLNMFEYEVNNLDSTPQRPEFNSLNLGLSFDSGEFSIIYPTPSEIQLFSVTVSTPFSMYQLFGGDYFFRISGQSVVAYVVQGQLQVMGAEGNTKNGSAALSTTFEDPLSGVSNKIISSVKELDTVEQDRFSAPVIAAKEKYDDVQFFIVTGTIVGIDME